MDQQFAMNVVENISLTNYWRLTFESTHLNTETRSIVVISVAMSTSPTYLWGVTSIPFTTGRETSHVISVASCSPELTHWDHIGKFMMELSSSTASTATPHTVRRGTWWTTLPGTTLAVSLSTSGWRPRAWLSWTTRPPSTTPSSCPSPISRSTDQRTLQSSHFTGELKPWHLPL